MLSSKAIRPQFVIAILCPTASFSDLLQEARDRHMVILEMVPFSENFEAYQTHIAAGTAVLFVLGSGKAIVVKQAEDLPAALDACRCCTASPEIAR